MIIIIFTILCLFISGYSLYFDWGGDAYTWFQRSGALIVLSGAILGYRSIVRLGVSGVGGAPDNGMSIGKLKESYIDENGRQIGKVVLSNETIELEFQLLLDKIFGYIGVLLVIAGTIICGYGDLLAIV